ncbi:amino acid transporter [Gloeophyllum trabeum ATCC 11539]|uniref:Amino acid transporter n=1 Tax=Gloeophyllum trabeum (strain ATCC 11539 / FP-39264 / Madison 617) TaxID=670483 RepID=S7PSM2_GLOTA|nr:amino acid transporter [Gloeophyllum trabeum ATCC 11539]EPQ50387.1 amino acid transporter [Gloeophyllum trabeum ATCC 11539]
MTMRKEAAPPRESVLEVKSGDVARLESLGYKQEFQREFTPWELFGVMFSAIGAVPSFASVLIYAIPNGGPVAMVWGWAICTIFIVLIGLAIAELGSAAPTSGGLYYWTYSLSSPRWRCLLCWLDFNTIGLVAGVAAVEWGLAVQLNAAISIGSDERLALSNAHIFYGTQHSYEIYREDTVPPHRLESLVSLKSRFMTDVSLRSSSRFLLPHPRSIGTRPALPSGTFKIARILRMSARGANYLAVTGWSPGFAFIMSFLAPLWAVGGFDDPVHISEEASNASTAVPWAIIMGTSAPAVIGWVLNVVVAFCMGTDLGDIVDSTIGQPLAVVFLNSFGKPGALAMWSIIITLQFMMGTSTLTVASRQSFAFSRDGALPFSSRLYRINRRTQTPVNCVWLVAGLAGVLGLLSFAGSAAIGAVFTLAAAAPYVAYSIPIMARFIFDNDFKPGPFTLGRFSFPVAATAVAWMLFAVVVFLFPANPNPTASDMNYTVAVLGAVALGSLLYYYCPVYGGVHWFKGPIANVNPPVLLSSPELDEKDVEYDTMTSAT